VRFPGFVAFIVASAVALPAALAPAHAEKRVAVVIGNDRYANLEQLQKAANDARAVGAALQQIGFDVIAGENLGGMPKLVRCAAYVDWLADQTRKPYRLLSEAEWEYAARARTEGGVDASVSPWRRFGINDFGLQDIFGVAWQWTMDCPHADYKSAPVDGSAWVDAACSRRVLRGGSRESDPSSLRAALRWSQGFGNRDGAFGLRVARTLTP
jgi:hypothetical protein